VSACSHSMLVRNLTASIVQASQRRRARHLGVHHQEDMRGLMARHFVAAPTRRFYPTLFRDNFGEQRLSAAM
jgi:hypothetical protein